MASLAALQETVKFAQDWASHLRNTGPDDPTIFVPNRTVRGVLQEFIDCYTDVADWLEGDDEARESFPFGFIYDAANDDPIYYLEDVFLKEHELWYTLTQVISIDEARSALAIKLLRSLKDVGEEANLSRVKEILLQRILTEVFALGNVQWGEVIVLLTLYAVNMEYPSYGPQNVEILNIIFRDSAKFRNPAGNFEVYRVIDLDYPSIRKFLGGILKRCSKSLGVPIKYEPEFKKLLTDFSKLKKCEGIAFQELVSDTTKAVMKNLRLDGLGVAWSAFSPKKEKWFRTMSSIVDTLKADASSCVVVKAEITPNDVDWVKTTILNNFYGEGELRLEYNAKIKIDDIGIFGETDMGWLISNIIEKSMSAKERNNGFWVDRHDELAWRQTMRIFSVACVKMAEAEGAKIEKIANPYDAPVYLIWLAGEGSAGLEGTT